MYLKNNINAIQSLNESTLLLENIFDFETYTKEKQAELKEAINQLGKIFEEKYVKIDQHLMKKYRDFYKFTGLEPIYIITTLDNRTMEFVKMILEMEYDDVTTSDIKKVIKDGAPFELSVNFEISVEEEKKTKNFKGKVVLIFVPENTLWNRLARIQTYRHITNGILNHPLWSEIEFLIFLLHETIEAEESIVYNRNNHHSGVLVLNSKDTDYQISDHHSILVLAKEAIILNRYKNIKALKALREMRYIEWKTIKSLTGIDFSTLTKLDKATERKLLNLKPSDFKDEYDNERKVVKQDLDKAINTSIKGYTKKLPKLAKNNITSSLINKVKNKIKDFIKPSKK